MIKSSRFMLATAFFLAGALFAQDAQVTPLMSKDLPEYPGKEGVMITVVYPPGASDPIHRHNAHAFVFEPFPVRLLSLDGYQHRGVLVLH